MIQINQIRKKSGIYIIKNAINNKILICCSKNIRSNMLSQFSELKRNNHKNKELQEDWNTYGDTKIFIDFYEYCNDYRNTKLKKISEYDSKDLYNITYNKNVDYLLSYGKSGVYSIINTITNNKYIGSSVNIYNRALSHFTTLKRGNHYNNPLQKDYDKYGRDAFTFIILEECHKDLLLEKEQHYIDQSDDFSQLYNISPKSDTTLGVQNPSTFNPVLQYKLDGAFVKKWYCCKEAIREYGRVVQKCVTGGCNKAYGYYWEFEDPARRQKATYRRNKRLSVSRRAKRPINKYDLNTGEFIESYESCVLAAKFTKSDASDISRAARNINKCKPKFIWVYPDIAQLIPYQEPTSLLKPTK